MNFITSTFCLQYSDLVTVRQDIYLVLSRESVTQKELKPQQQAPQGQTPVVISIQEPTHTICSPNSSGYCSGSDLVASPPDSPCQDVRANYSVVFDSPTSLCNSSVTTCYSLSPLGSINCRGGSSGGVSYRGDTTSDSGHSSSTESEMFTPTDSSRTSNIAKMLAVLGDITPTDVMDVCTN